MDDDRSIFLEVFVIIFLTIILFFPTFIIMDMYFEALFLRSCFISFVFAVVIFYIFIWSRGSKQKVERETEKVETQKEKASAEEVSVDGIDKVEVGDEREKGKKSILDKIKGKKTCDMCGTELVYKEEMDSYYCPECHEYK